MKLVNPKYIGIERTFQFRTFDVGCDDFEDKYTHSTYGEHGCFGCEALEGRYHPACNKSHTVVFRTVKKEPDGKIANKCNTFKGKRVNNTYYNSSCSGCSHLYRGGGMWKCKMGNTVETEAFRSG